MIDVTCGRFETRTRRIVDIVESRQMLRTSRVAGEPGIPTTIWIGTMYQADGRTVDGRYEWTADGNFLNNQGVTHPHDLVLCLRRDPPPPNLADAIAGMGAAPAPEPQAQPVANARAKAKAKSDDLPPVA